MTSSAQPIGGRPEISALSQPPRGLWADVWHRLLRKKRAVFGLAAITFFIMVALVAPVLAPHDPLRLNFGSFYLPPSWVKESATGKVGDARFLLGTDTAGRDILSRLIYGTRASMFIGLSTTPIVALIGTLIGLAAGYAGGRKGSLIMRMVDVFYAFPAIMFYILIVLTLRQTAFGKWMNGLAVLLLALVLIGWVGLARLTYSSVLSIKESQFVEAARSIGASNRRILARHILPNCLSLIVVWIAFTIPRMIMIEAVLGYLNIGLIPVVDSSQSVFVTTWGGLFLDGRLAINNHPIMLLAPTLCVALVGMAFTFVGDALRDLLDPHMRNLI